MPRPRETPGTGEKPSTSPERRSPGARGWTIAAVGSLLLLHWSLEVSSLLQENATVDEVAHLPAGVSYWQTGTFKLYHHNPPLVKLVAALPVVASGPVTAPLYSMKAWTHESQAGFGQYFALFNADRYLDLFARARLMMPLFSVVGALVVYAWSSRLYGVWGGLLSLSLWCLCPNILAHGRLVTSDGAASSMAVLATYLFWRYQKGPTWTAAFLSGVALGLAQLTKFSLVLLYGLWPALVLVRIVFEGFPEGWRRRVGSRVGQGTLMVGLSVLVVDLGYGFEGVGTPLGKLEFASRSLTVPVAPGTFRPSSENILLSNAWQYRVNRFRGTIFGSLPSPLPRHFLLGFDEQKIETEGFPEYYLNPTLPHDDSKMAGYSVYLDGQLRRGGWWYYYLATLAYKVPEGTWALVLLSSIPLVCSKRSRAPWPDEITLLAIPVGVLGAMSFLTDICLGLRYILPIFPFVFIATGKVAPWVMGLRGVARWPTRASAVAALLGTALATASIHPDYLSYFNAVSGGPDRGGEHLIDSNLDWGQDLVRLKAWLQANHPGRPFGLAYFGQINPSLLAAGGEPFPWFLPPALPGKLEPMPGVDLKVLVGPAKALRPGLYAVSASIVNGLSWRHCDSVSLKAPELSWLPPWNADNGAFAYFGEITPVERVGHSIYVYEVTQEDCDRLAPLWSRPR